MSNNKTITSLNKRITIDERGREHMADNISNVDIKCSRCTAYKKRVIIYTRDAASLTTGSYMSLCVCCVYNEYGINIVGDNDK